MAANWRFVLLLTLVILGSYSLEAKTSRIMNLNVPEEGTAEGTGFGIGLYVPIGLEGNVYRGRVYSTSNGDFLGNGRALDRSDSAFGINMDYQFGSDTDMVATDFGLDVTSYSVETNGFSLFSAATIQLNWNMNINFLKSEEIESDGIRRHNDWALSMIVGPSLGILMGDLSDLNGVRTIGLNVGVGFDIPMYEDLVQVAPSAWFEVNYHLGDEVQADIFDETRSDRTDPTALDGVVIRSHTLIPPYAFNLGADWVFTPLLQGRSGKLINNWRFSVGTYLTFPFSFNSIAADRPGDGLITDKDGMMYFTLSFQAAYFW